MSPPPDPLERLLAEVPAPATPPWFSARTLARLRQQQAPRSSWHWLRWALPVTATCSIALWFFLTPAPPPGAQPDSAPIAQTQPDDLTNEDLVAALQTFVAYVEERDQWPLEFAGSPQLSW